MATNEKSDEITAVPELLKLPDIEKSVVTADAASSQTEIVKTIVAGKADYAIAAKRNRPGLYECIEKKFQEFSGKTEVFITSEPRESQREKREHSLINFPTLKNGPR